ncbi:MAG: AtpZ/AtpI family protein [Elusimicrobia bacterium]|nr:AtpZ/AtpI family protein [Elusimicrobiota bacterium]
MAAFTLLGFGIGYWLDEKLGSSPWGALILTLGGVGLALYRLVRTFAVPRHGDESRR